MLKHLLVPLDGSKLAEEALRYAREIIAPNGRISLIAAVVPPEKPAYVYLAPVVPPANPDLLPIAEHYLEGLAYAHSNGDIIYDYHAIIGDPVAVITQQAEILRVDAIVMTTHGRSGISRFVLGSVTAKVLAEKVCPVLVVFQKEAQAVPLGIEDRSWEARQ